MRQVMVDEVERAAKAAAPQLDWNRKVAQKREHRTAPALATLEGLQRCGEISDEPPQPLQQSFPCLQAEDGIRHVANGNARLAKTVCDGLYREPVVVLGAGKT